jgi:hypothetical protein
MCEAVILRRPFGTGPFGSIAAVRRRRVPAPEGHIDNSPTFRTLGSGVGRWISPGGTADGTRHGGAGLSAVPSGLIRYTVRPPRLKTWAILRRPFGTGAVLARTAIGEGFAVFSRQASDV